MLKQSGVSPIEIYQEVFLKVPLYERSNNQLLSQSTFFIAFYQQKVGKNEILQQFEVSTNDIYQENTCARDFFKHSRMAEGVQRYSKEAPTKVFSYKYCEYFKTPIYFGDYLRTAASESKAEFVQSMQIIQCVAKIYQKTFFKVAV